MRKLALLLSVLLLTGEIFAAPPEWLQTRRYREYSPDFDYVGIGQGASLQAAVDAATADISRQIQVSVIANQSSVIQSAATNDLETITSDYLSSVRTVTSATLKGVATVQTAQDGDNYYAFCYLDRNNYASSLANDIASAHEKLRQADRNANDLLAKGKLFAALETWLAAESVENERDARLALYNTVSGKSSGNKSDMLLAEIAGTVPIATHISQTVGKLKIEAPANPPQTAPRGRPLSDPYKARILWGDIPVEGAVVKLTDLNWEAIERRATDANGEALFYLTAAGEGVQTLYASLESPVADERVTKPLRNAVAQFSYTSIAVEPQIFDIIVKGENGERLATVEQSIARTVTDAGHRVGQGESKLKLKGVVRVNDRKKIEGVNGAQFVASLELTLTIERASGETVATLKAKASGLGKASEQAAFEDGCRKLNISADKFAETVAGM